MTGLSERFPRPLLLSVQATFELPTFKNCQVRESPDGANSSVLNGGRASVSSTVPPATPSDGNPSTQGIAESNPLPEQELELNASPRIYSKCSDNQPGVDKNEEQHQPKLDGNPFPKKPSLIPRTRRRDLEKRGGGGGNEYMEKDIMMDFVSREIGQMEKGGSFQNDQFTKKRPAKVKVRSTKRSRSLSSVSSQGKSCGRLNRSVERLPTLSAFDEERIVWLKAYEDDLAMEEERRRRNRMIRTAANKALQVGNSRQP